MHCSLPHYLNTDRFLHLCSACFTCSPVHASALHSPTACPPSSVLCWCILCFFILFWMYFSVVFSCLAYFETFWHILPFWTWKHWPPKLRFITRWYRERFPCLIRKVLTWWARFNQQCNQILLYFIFGQFDRLQLLKVTIDDYSYPMSEQE